MRVSQTHNDTPCAARDELGGIQPTAHYSLSPGSASPSRHIRSAQKVIAQPTGVPGPGMLTAEEGGITRPLSLPSDAHASLDMSRLRPIVRKHGCQENKG